MNAQNLYEAFGAAGAPSGRASMPAFERLSVAARERWEAVATTARRLMQKEFGMNPAAEEAERLARVAEAAEQAAEAAMTRAEEAREAADKAAAAKEAEAKRQAEEEAKAKAAAASKAKAAKSKSGAQKPKESGTDK